MRVHGHADNDSCVDERDEEIAHLELFVPVGGVTIYEKAEPDTLGEKPHRGLVEVVVGRTSPLLPAATAIEVYIEVRPIW